MPKLTATPEMKQAAIADEPKQHESPYGYRYVERTYYPYMNCVVQDGILKAAFYLPEHLRLDGNNPAYEVFLDKKAHQFLTYDHLEKKMAGRQTGQAELAGEKLLCHLLGQ